MKVTKKKSVTEVHTYHLTKEIKYKKTFVNGKETSRKLHYAGKKLYGYGLEVIYKLDRSILSKTNPYWGDNKYQEFKFDLLEPENIDLKDLCFGQSASHTFWELDKSPIPVVVGFNYIKNRVTDYYYDLDSLKKHLDSHNNIITCSDIKDIPYYNADENNHYYLEGRFLPEKEWLEDLYSEEKDFHRLDSILGYPWDFGKDYFNIEQFCIRKEY